MINLNCLTLENTRWIWTPIVTNMHPLFEVLFRHLIVLPNLPSFLECHIHSYKEN